MTQEIESVPVLIVAGEGGSIALVKKSILSTLFALSTQEINFELDDEDLSKSPALHWLSWEQALVALEAYPWRRLMPLRVLAEHADVLQDAYCKQSVPGHIGERWERLFAQTASIQTIERRLHALMDQKVGELIGVSAVILPRLSAPADATTGPAWFPIPGMYGGFSFGWADRTGEPMLVVESWSRVVEGSGQRHHIDADKCVLVDEGFV